MLLTKAKAFCSIKLFSFSSPFAVNFKTKCNEMVQNKLQHSSIKTLYKQTKNSDVYQMTIFTDGPIFAVIST